MHSNRKEEAVSDFVLVVGSILALLFSIIILMSGCMRPVQTPIPPPPVSGKDWTITLAWDFDFSNYPPCTASLAKNCIAGFTWGYLDGAAQVPLHMRAVPAGATGPVGGITDAVNSLLPLGLVKFYVSANFIDQNGAAQTSTGTTGTLGNGPDISVALKSPSNIAVTLQ